MSDKPWDGITDRRSIDAISRHEWDGMTRWVKEIDDKLDGHTEAETRMEERINSIETDLKEVRQDVKSILDVLTKARGIWSFMGWLAGAVATLGGIVALFWDKR